MASTLVTSPVEDIIVLSSDEEQNGRPMSSNTGDKSSGDAMPSTSSTDMSTMSPSTSSAGSAGVPDSRSAPSKQHNGCKEGNRMSRKRYGRIVKEVDVFLENWRFENAPERDIVFHYLVLLDSVDGKLEIASRLLKMHYGLNPLAVVKKEAMASLERKQYMSVMVIQVKELMNSMDPPCDVDDAVVEGYLAVLDGAVTERIELTTKLLRFNHLIHESQTFADLNGEVEQVFSHSIMRTACTEKIVRKFLTILHRSQKRAVIAADLLDVVSMAVAEHESAGRGSKRANAASSNVGESSHRSNAADVVAENFSPMVSDWSTNGEYDELQQALLKDADTIVDIFPHIDRQEAYAYLEVHVDRPDRVYAVIEELMYNAPLTNNVATGNLLSPTDQGAVSAVHHPAGPAQLSLKRNGKNIELDSAELPDKKAKTATSLPNLTTQVAPKPEPITASDPQEDSDSDVDGAMLDVNGNVEPNTLCALEERREVLRSVFPAADPDFLHELVVSCDGDDELLKQRVDQLVDTKNYPLLQDRLKRENMEKMRVDYTTRLFTPREILEWNSDPLKYFYDTDRLVSRRYHDLAHKELCNQFPKVREPYLKGLLYSKKGHFIPCLRLLETLDWSISSSHCRKSRGKRAQCPLEPDETFYKELAFSRVEHHFRDYLKSIEAEKEAKMKKARADNTLVTCNCCFDDELLHEDIVTCEGGQHLFCRECVRRGMEVAIGQTKTELQCMTDRCEAKFSRVTLESVLNANVYANLVRRIETAEIEQAQIDDLEKCPHCSFAAIMSDHNDKVFRCLNPECLKETCRLCKEPSHIPLRCEEVEQASEVRMRTYIENKMSEALMRECPTCKRRFTKEFGCNMMTCICGSKMCYVCRKAVRDYDHFGPDRCPQESNLEQLHHEDVTKGANQAKQEFVIQNPDFQNMNLKHDPLNDLPRVPPLPAPPPPALPRQHPLPLNDGVKQQRHDLLNVFRDLDAVAEAVARRPVHVRFTGQEQVRHMRMRFDAIYGPSSSGCPRAPLPLLRPRGRIAPTRLVGLQAEAQAQAAQPPGGNVPNPVVIRPVSTVTRTTLANVRVDPMSPGRRAASAGTATGRHLPIKHVTFAAPATVTREAAGQGGGTNVPPTVIDNELLDLI